MGGNLKATLISFILLAVLIHRTDQNGRQKRQIATDQPRIMTQGGHLVFQTAANHNITFQSNSGGFINLDGENFKAVVQIVKNNKQQIEEIQSGGNLGDVDRRLGAVESRLDALQPTGEVQNRLEQLTTQLNDLTTRVSALEVIPTSSSSDSSSDDAQLRRLRRKVDRIEEQLEQLQQLLTTNECASNPCRNGGTCVDQFNSYFCRCPSNWQGSTCEVDVNECSAFAGTDLGCKNGATCVNSPGTYQCQCPPNFYGIRCSETHNDCTGANVQELCGHGTCVNQPRAQGGEAKFKCICDGGWSTDSSSSACTVDVDECSAAGHPPCSVNPQVLCVNVPGSFVCGPCPLGYSGNGYFCVDIDECGTNNGGCSQAPLVQCTNTVGSYNCEPCPPGYNGNGVTCNYVGLCNQNNGGCHPRAACRENPGISGVTCTCPDGFMGNGVGQNGCTEITSGSGGCASNPCVYGSCRDLGNNYICGCFAGYTGTRCETEIMECDSNPCQNQATCVDQVNGYICQCVDGYTGINCEESQQSCGGRMNVASGSLRYPPEEGEGYAHETNCGWVISTAPSKIIILNFTDFHLEHGSTCQYDFLQINDGPTASSHTLGKFCGTELPNGGSLNSTHNQLYLWFHSDASVGGDGFALTWTSADPVCGGDLRGSNHGSISSPGYPGNYPNNRECTWTVQISPGNNILFTFGHLAMEHHDNCTYDYMLIRDGLLDTDPLLKRWCSSSDPAPVRTTGPYARVFFHSDYSNTDTGFHITYASIGAGNGCGGAFTADHGIMISPNFPNPYPQDSQCIYTVTVQENEVMNFTFTDLGLEAETSGGTCEWDYVELRDGADETAPLVGRYCGDTVPSAFMTSTNRLWVKFKSDASTHGPGFRATWAVVCGGLYTEDGAIIRSPYHPAAYPSNKECEYLIEAPEGSSITLTFTSFGTEKSDDELCRFDYLEVRNGGTSDADLIGRLCGDQLPPPVSSSNNVMYLKFVSDGSVSNHGFSANIEFREGMAGCGGNLIGTIGSFSSPGHPNEYPHGVTCHWFITVEAGMVIRLTFNTFNLEHNTNCQYDYVEISDNSTSTETGGILGRYCSTVAPPVLTSTENVMHIVFVSDASVATEGFSASYVALNASTICGQDKQEETGVIQSPNYPDNYPHGRNCEWRITVDSGRQVLLNVTSFNLEMETNCEYDYLEIRDGGYPTSPLIGKYCGPTMSDPIIRSHSNRMYLRFRSDRSTSRSGFQIYYDGTLSGCGGDLSAPSGSFVSPNFPLAYGRNAECFWTIHGNRGSFIHLQFMVFQVEGHGECNYDYVEVRDGSAVGPVLGKLCGREIPQPIESKSNIMHVKFRTDYSNAGKGFHATYYTNCNNRLTDYSGVIESPNFPEDYPHNRDCTWVIETTMGNQINVSFSHLSIEGHAECQYDYLEVRDGQSYDSPLIGKYCGISRLPPPLMTSDRYLYVHFVSDASIGSNGFRLEYVTNGCGGTLSGESGMFTSPEYPQPYPHQRECVWKIEVHSGNSIELTINDFDVEKSENCDYDVLEIYGGPDDHAPLLGRLCDTRTTEQLVSSTGSHMYVRFKSDVGRSGRGFRATFKAVAGGCGGNFTSPTGNIVSKNYPEPYPAKSDCTWQITVDTGRTVELTFTDFDVENHSSCNYDHVTVYDGSDASSPVLVKACGNGLPTPSRLTSSSNVMYIRMSADDSLGAKGFQASYKTGCGGRLDAEEDGEIVSPGWPGVYEPNRNCTWIIQPLEADNRITLTFTHIDLEELNDCAHDYVKVMEGNDINGPEVGRYCGNRIPAPITSEGSALTIQFTSDNTDSRSGFRAVYTKSTSACGGDLTSEHGAFNSPQYPAPYANNAECMWTIKASPGNKIVVTFSVFDLEQSDYCNKDFVEIREGGAGGDVLGRYCGNTLPSNMTTGHDLWIKFRTSADVQGLGFMADYSFVHGGTLEGESGQLASPLYPNQYPHNSDYSWTITVPVDKYVSVTFRDIDIERSTEVLGRCAFDYVRFHEGPSGDAPVMNSYCGMNLPEPFHSSGNHIYVKFISDFSTGGRGFLFDWEAVSTLPVTPPPPDNTSAEIVPGCGGDLIAGEAIQEFASPGYPSGYANNLDCEWRITSVPGTRVMFNITDINLESHTRCNYDVITVTEVRSWHRDRELGKFCGRQGNTEPLTLESNQLMKVRLTTDSSVNRTGFAASYQTVCGGYWTREAVGTVQSPGYPGAYPQDSNCTWHIGVHPGRTIRLSWEQFDLQAAAAGGNCTSDYLEFYNGYETSSPLIATACGNQAPTIPETSSHRLTLRFVSDSSIAGAGFRFTFREISIVCGGRLELTSTVTQGELTSPNYPGAYPHSLDCIWQIVAPAGRQVQLDFEDFEVESGRGCRFDYVETRDGGTSNSPLINPRSCGNEIPSSAKSTGKVMYVRFRSDTSHVGDLKGFKAKYSIATCGGSYYGETGVITSHNYPSNYGNNEDCEWTLRGLRGHYLTLTFDTLNLAGSANCSNGDIIEIRDLNATGPLLATVCGRTIPEPTETSDSYAHVRFVTDSENVRSGFQMRYTSSLEVCGGSLTTSHGTFTSPLYPQQYTHRRRCTWDIEVEPGRSITLTFDDFDLEHSDNCRFDGVRVSNGILDTSPFIGRYCGTTIPEPIQSSGNTMRVQFYTDASRSGRGFSVSYNSDNEAKCGFTRRINIGDNGTISSPGFLNGTYDNSEQCIWTLRKQNFRSASITIRFRELAIERHGECLYDYVEIKSGWLEGQTVVYGRFCGNDTIPPPVVTASPIVEIMFVTDWLVVDRGFELNYKVSDCGGLVLTQPNGTITSPNYPNNYDHVESCAWLIIADEMYQITLTSRVFQIEEHEKCEYDYVEVFNGNLPSSPSVGKFCGTSGPMNIKSQSNTLRIEFHTDISMSELGFVLEYTMEAEGCGGNLHAQNGLIESPNHPERYPSNTECVWEITVNNGYHVNLNFMPPFELEIQETCVGDFVEVTDVVDDDGTETNLGRYCGNTFPSQQLTSTGNKMLVTFRTDGSNNYNGFAATFEAECGTTYTAASGTVISPGYPNNYDNNMDCAYLITVDPQHFVTLTFKPEHFAIEGVRGRPPPKANYSLPTPTNATIGETDGYLCAYDWVEVFAGNDSSARSLGKFCGLTAPQAMSSLGTMYIEFHTDYTITDKGWVADYITSQCGGEFTEPYGTIETPSKPKYHHFANCTWHINVQENRAVAIKFNKFDIEAHARCVYDWVAIYDGDSLSAPLIGTFCGDVAPDVIMTRSNSMLVQFVTDGSVAREGFMASYRTTFGELQGCGGLLNATTGRFGTFDASGNGLYEANLDCQWQIVVPDGNVVTLTFESFNLEAGRGGCRYDYVEVRDGFYPDAELVGTYCGSTVPETFTASSNVLFVKFFSDNGVEGTGFNATFTAEEALCGGVGSVTTEWQVITSPNYPSDYPQDVRCRWTLEAPENEHIHVEITDLDIQSHVNCQNDFVQITDAPVGQLGKSIHYCGSTIPPPFVSLGRSVSINFAADDSGSAKGFSLRYQIASCNRTYTAVTGRIVSPGWPGDYPTNANCMMNVTVPQGNKLQFFFSYIQIESHDSCAYDYVQILNGSSRDSGVMATVCGHTVPNPVFINNNAALINFVTDLSVTHRGFDITYTSSPEGCGGNLTAINGTFASPAYPGHPTQAQTCIWRIKVPARRKVSFSFATFYMGDSEECEGNYVELRNGLTESDSFVGRYCGSDTPADFTSSGVGLFVKYSVSGNFTGTGFRALYTS